MRRCATARRLAAFCEEGAPGIPDSFCEADSDRAPGFVLVNCACLKFRVEFSGACRYNLALLAPFTLI